MNDRPGPEDLLEFPCDYVFKAMGPNNDYFVLQVRRAVESTIPVSRDSMKVRPSSKGNYVSVSIMVQVQNFTQITEIYKELRRIEELKYLL